MRRYVLCEKQICDWLAYSHHSEKVWDVYNLYNIHSLIVKRWRNSFTVNGESKNLLDSRQEVLMFGDTKFIPIA